MGGASTRAISTAGLSELPGIGDTIGDNVGLTAAINPLYWGAAAYRTGQGIATMQRRPGEIQAAQEAATAQQNNAAAAAAEALRTAPKKMDRQTLGFSPRARAGLMANIRAGNLGGAPALRSTGLEGKPLLGQ